MAANLFNPWARCSRGLCRLLGNHGEYSGPGRWRTPTTTPPAEHGFGAQIIRTVRAYVTLLYRDPAMDPREALACPGKRSRRRPSSGRDPRHQAGRASLARCGIELRAGRACHGRQWLTNRKPAAFCGLTGCRRSKEGTMKKKNRMIARPAEPADQRCWTRIPCLPEYRAEITDSSGRPQSVTVEEISVAGGTLRSSQGLNVALGDTLQVSFSSVTLSATVQNVAPRAEPIAAVGRAMARPEVNEDRLFAS